MLKRPALSLKESDLIEGKEAPSSGHKVMTVTFCDIDGTMKHGYKKPCDNDYYPPLLAKYVVAFSILVRAALGEKASEDRLVYNSAGKIVATVSIEVPNFVPLLTLWRSHDDPEKNKLGAPDKKMLIKENVAELLVSAYKHKNNDLHPSNISINGLIDWDELYYELTSIIKGGRLFDSPIVSGELKEQDLRTFPIVGARIHWPANYIPKNWNLLKIYKTGAFTELQGDKDFIPQYFTAILKELLAFDKKMLTERMKLYLGNEGLDLHELPSKKRAALLSFGSASKLFFDDREKEREFVEHVLLFLEQENNKFKHIILNMPEFQDFLMISNKNPKEILNIKKWFIAQNKKNHVPYSLDFVDIELHTIWRECFKQKFIDDIKQLDEYISLAKSSPLNKSNGHELEMTYEQLDSMITAFIKPEDINPSKTSFTSKQEEKPEEILLLSKEIYLKIRMQATHLYDQITDLKNQYYAKANATIKDNHTFIEAIKKTIDSNRNDRKQLQSWLQEYKIKSKEKKEIEIILDHHIYDMRELFNDIEKFNKKIETTLNDFHMNYTIAHVLPPIPVKNLKKMGELKELPPSKTHTPPEPLSIVDDAKSALSFSEEHLQKINDGYDFIHTDNTIIHHLSKHLNQWITSDKEALLNSLIKEVYTQDYDARSKGYMTGTVYNFFRTRGDEVLNKSITQIFSTGKWNPTSLNTLIIKKLCLTMLAQEKHDPYLKSIYDRIVMHDDNWWSTVALTIAVKSNLKNPTNMLLAPAMAQAAR